MKTGMKLILAALLIVAAAFTSTAIASAVSHTLELTFNPVGWFVGSAITTTILVAFTPKMPVNIFPAVTVELWVKYIIDNLFKDNAFLEQSYKEDDYVLGGAVVHIPQAGAKPTVIKNNTTYPLTAVLRADGDITYPLDTFSTVPTLIPKAEEMEISYDKQGSVLGEHVQALGDDIADNILYNWRATSATNIVRTTGGSGTSLADGATGNRKIFTKESLKKARTIMNKQNIPKTDRFAILPSEFYDELMDDTTLLSREYQKDVDIKDGVVEKLYGFKIYERSSVLVYDNSGTPVAKAVGAAGAADDNLAAICWQKNCVAKALGTTNFFENLDDALYQGNIYSALVKMGGRKRRANGEGVVAIVQAAA